MSEPQSPLVPGSEVPGSEVAVNSDPGRWQGLKQWLWRWRWLLGCTSLGLVVAIATSTWFGLRFLDQQLERLIETNLTKAMGVEVTLTTVDVQPLRSGVVLYGLAIANPKGFSAQDIITVEQAVVRVVPQTLRNKTIEFKQVAIEGVKLRWEQQDATSNVLALMQQINAKTQQGEIQTQLGVPVYIQQLSLTDSNVTANLNLFGSFGFEQRLPIPDVELEDVDVENLASQLVPTILQALREQFLPWLQREQDDPKLQDITL
ncbi:MAG: hypothetical protein AAGF24_01500 [Cyanobacteria bacterium P01_H01_bin.121]